MENLIHIYRSRPSHDHAFSATLAIPILVFLALFVLLLHITKDKRQLAVTSQAPDVSGEGTQSLDNQY